MRICVHTQAAFPALPSALGEIRAGPCRDDLLTRGPSLDQSPGMDRMRGVVMIRLVMGDLPGLFGLNSGWGYCYELHLPLLSVSCGGGGGGGKCL